MYQFDSGYERVFGPVDVKEAPDYHLYPRGSTALLDATHKAIIETGDFLRRMPEADRPSQVKVIVVTDGQENSSVEVTRQILKDAITHQEQKYGWEFIYIGSDPSTYQEAHSAGFSNTVRYNSVSTADMYRGLSKGITTSRMTGSSVTSNMDSTYGDIDSNSSVQSSVSSS